MCNAFFCLPSANPKTQYSQYFPSWTPNQKYPMLDSFEHHEHAKDADPTFPNLKPTSAHIKHLTPSTGSVITGIQLSSLTRQAKDEIALLVAQRKVVAFRSQDFKDLPISSIVDFCKYFGPLAIFPLGPYLPNYPEIHIAHNGADDTRLRDSYAQRTTSMSWHTDSSANSQPPGLVFLYMLECPDVGGDTVFINTAEAYKKLSQPLAERLHGLKAEHKARTGVTSVHPVVRTHPVTGEKCLFVNPLCASLSISFPASYPWKNSAHWPHRHYTHHRLQDRRKRRSAPIPLRTPRLLSRLSGPRSLDAGYGRYLRCTSFNHA